jgi:tetratricopeptide (TPR) repeat protein
MGKLLFKGARLATDSRTLRRYATAVLTSNAHTSLARSLPLSEDSRSFVGRVNGRDTVAVLLESGGYPISEVSRDITTLVQMGLFGLQREGSQGDKSKRDVEPVLPAQTGAAMQGMGLDRVRKSNQSEDPALLLQRLKKELLTIQDAPPPVVLGVPADAERALVDKAGARMRQRYAELTARKDLSVDVRKMALEIAKKVDAAHRHFNFERLERTGATTQAGISVHDDVEQMLDEARALIEAKRWTDADRLLSKAHEKRIDHVAVLANLGWARLHNPNQSLESRTEEGKDFLLLAEEFDPTNGEGQYYMAQILVASSRLDAAEQRAERAAQADPSDTARAALLRKIRVLRAQQEAKAR